MKKRERNLTHSARLRAPGSEAAAKATSLGVRDLAVPNSSVRTRSADPAAAAHAERLAGGGGLGGVGRGERWCVCGSEEESCGEERTGGARTGLDVLEEAALGEALEAGVGDVREVLRGGGKSGAEGRRRGGSGEVAGAGGQGSGEQWCGGKGGGRERAPRR